MQRKTQQRGTIRKVMEAAGRPMSPQEVHEEACHKLPKLGIATVYRNIKALVEEEWLTVVEVPGGPNRYEVAGKHHHHHFHCNHCDRLYEVDRCPGELSDLTPAGFRLEAHEIMLYGTCRHCMANT